MPPATAETEQSTATTQVKIDDAGPARKRLTITVPAKQVDEKLRESMGTLSTATALPGFRKGRAPQALLERRFGTSVRAETKNQLVAAAYASAIEDNKIKPVGEPEPGEGMADLKLEPGKPLVFSLEVEVLPEFELPALEGIEVKKPMLEITDQHIKDELKRQQVLVGTPSSIEGDFKEGDRVGGYATVTKNEEAEPFFRQDNVLLIMPSEADNGRGQVLGLMIDNLHGMLRDMKVGDTLVIEAVGPEAHEREDIRGVKLKISFDIRIAERITPATPSEVAAKYGIPNEDILREQIKLAMEVRRDEEQASAMREQVTDQLSAMINVEMPEKLSAAQAARNLEQYRMELLSRGVSVEEVEEKLAEVRSEAESQARERLKRFFILNRLGEHFGIEVSEQEVNGRVAAIAAQRNVRPDKLRAELAQAGRLGEVARMLRDQKAADRVVQNAKQIEVNAEEWNKIFQDRQKQSAGGKSEKKSPKKTPADKPEAEKKSAKVEKPEKTEKSQKPAPKSKAPAAAAEKKKPTKKK